MDWAKRILALGLGLLFTVAFAETILRGIGAVQNLQRSGDAASVEVDTSNKTFRIVSLGNSYTVGSGAPPGHSFSDHLQRMLDEERRAMPIRVINRGRGNVNSTYILEALPENIEKFRPNVIVLMAGECNVWNRYHYNTYLKRLATANGAFFATWKDDIYDVLYGFRTFRLITMLVRPHLTASTYVTGRYSVAFPGDDVANFSVVGRKWIGALENGNSFDVYQLNDEQRNEAISTLRALEAGGAKTREVYNTLARLYALSAKDFAKAAPYYAKALEMAPEMFNFYAYRELTEAIPSSRAKTPEQRAEMKRLIELASSAFPGEQKYKDLVKWFDTITLPGGYDLARNKEETIRFLEFARQSRETSVRTARLLATSYMDIGEYRKSAQALMATLRASPFSTEGELYGVLHKTGKASNDPVLQAEIAKFVEEMASRYPTEAIRNESVSDVQLADWIRSDLKEIIRLGEASGAKVVLQSYAPLRGGGKRIADEVIREIALEGKYAFADNMSEFSEAFRQRLDPEKVYSNEFGPMDSHLNSDGYRMMAEILKRTMEQNRMLPQ